MAPWHMAKIALTFNGDPQIIHQEQNEFGTAELLRVIEELSAQWDDPIRLTFFVTGHHLQQMMTQAPELLKRMAQGGHEIANHSFSQPKNFHELPISQALQEVRQTHDLIEQLFGQPPRLFRPPHGLISRDIETAIQAEFPDYQIVGWDRHDEKGGDTPSQFQQRLLSNIRDRQVVLLHSWRSATLWAIRDILAQLRERGFQCAPLSEVNRYPRHGLREILPPKAEFPRIALTFDDDPKVLESPDGVKLGTRELLNVVQELNQTSDTPIRVTLFAVGVNIEKALKHFPDVIEQIRAGRHEVQNHSYSHPSNFHQLSPTQAVDEVRRNHDLIAATFNQEPRFFRPPKGFINVANQEAILEAMPGYQICGWDRHDEKDYYQPDQLRRVVVDNARDQQIVLLHVWYKSTIWAVRGICQDLQAQRYQMVTMSDLERDPTLYGLKNPDSPVFA